MQEKTLDWLMSGAPSAPAGPEMPAGWGFSQALGGAFVSKREDGGQYALTITLLRTLLATQGLRIVGEAEAKVLEACAAIPLFELSYHGQCDIPPEHEWLTRAAKAELARRAQQKEKPHA